MTQENYFMLVCWLWHCAATAVALQMHEGVNAFNLVIPVRVSCIRYIIDIDSQNLFIITVHFINHETSYLERHELHGMHVPE